MKGSKLYKNQTKIRRRYYAKVAIKGSRYIPRKFRRYFAGEPDYLH